jgi:hypothetical protein
MLYGISPCKDPAMAELIDWAFIRRDKLGEPAQGQSEAKEPLPQV